MLRHSASRDRGATGRFRAPACRRAGHRDGIGQETTIAVASLVDRAVRYFKLCGAAYQGSMTRRATDALRSYLRDEAATFVMRRTSSFRSSMAPRRRAAEVS